MLKKLKTILHDLMYCEKDSGRYKYAKLQVQRMFSPFVALLTTSLMVLFLLIFLSRDTDATREIGEVVIDAVEVNEPLDEIPEIEHVEIQDVDFSDVDIPIEHIDVKITDTQTPVSPKPAPLNSVMNNYKSPIVMRGMLGSRNPGQIGAARRKYGGTQAGEVSVLNALRWLKTKQNSDGSWPKVKPAMTGLALLCYLAHGELPSDSSEFGPTVKKGIQYLLDTQMANGFFKGHDGNNYAHLIATYALCEAYSMTKNPIVKEACEKALVPIVQGQHPNGGWDYKMAQTARDDTSYMGWAAQAIKAGYLARDLEVMGLEEAYKKAPLGFKVNYHRDGGFGYTSPSHTSGLTAVGTLCMQLMDRGNDEAVKKSLDVMDEWILGWIPDRNDINTQAIPSSVGTGASQQYYAYYATQAMFQSGGKRWDRWNAMMNAIYPKMQKIQSKETSNYVDHHGDPQSIGHWENGDANEDSGPFVMDTCLACLQMEVYYRYLPTYEKVEIVDEDIVLDKSEDVAVDIIL